MVAEPDGARTALDGFGRGEPACDDQINRSMNGLAERRPGAAWLCSARLRSFDLIRADADNRGLRFTSVGTPRGVKSPLRAESRARLHLSSTGCVSITAMSSERGALFPSTSLRRQLGKRLKALSHAGRCSRREKPSMHASSPCRRSKRRSE